MPTMNAAEKDAIWRNQEAQLRAANLKRIETLSRADLLRFLDIHRATKDNTEKLRLSARRLAKVSSVIDIDRDLARILS